MKHSDFVISVLKENTAVYEVLSHINCFGLPQAHVGAGCIAQTVWNYKSGYPLLDNIKDIDLIYFDPADLSKEAEQEKEHEIREKCSHIPLEIDVKNQARVHLWYEQKFGYPVRAYTSVEDAVQTWPTTATSVAARLNGKNIEFTAPFGLEDMVGMLVRANKARITRDIYIAKVERWKKHWPELAIIPWEENAGSIIKNVDSTKLSG